MINLGSISMIITPLLRANVSCFGQTECYPLAFGLPAVLMTMAVVVFLLGRPSYVIKVGHPNPNPNPYPNPYPNPKLNPKPNPKPNPNPNPNPKVPPRNVHSTLSWWLLLP